MRRVDVVIHLAALGSVPRSIVDPMATHAANATGTLNVLEAARDADVGHVIVASSSSVYGMNPAIPKREQDWVRPMSPYAVSKLATEQYALAYQEAYGLPTLALRFFNVYGPRQTTGHAYAAVIPTFVDAVLRDRPVIINGDGRHSRDFTFVGSVCEVLIDAMVRRVSHPQPVNLAFGAQVNLNELIETIGEVAGRCIRVVHGPARPGDVRHSSADSTLLRSLFPQASPVPLRRGLAQTVDWFQASVPV
jgi:UDP-glucose 4-epimerase